VRKLLFALLLVAAAASITVPRLGDGGDLQLAVPAEADPAEAQRTVEARLTDAGLDDVEVRRDGRRLAFSPVDETSSDMIRVLASAFRLHIRPVLGTCEAATRPERTDPSQPVDLPVRPPSQPSCLELGPAIAGNDDITRSEASGTDVVIRFADLPLEQHARWAVEVDGEVLASPRLAEDEGAGVELVVDARTNASAIALAAGLAHPLPADLR